MAELKDPIIKKILQVADELQISKREAAEAVKSNFENDGLTMSAEHVQKYLDKLRE